MGSPWANFFDAVKVVIFHFFARWSTAVLGLPPTCLQKENMVARTFFEARISSQFPHLIPLRCHMSDIEKLQWNALNPAVFAVFRCGRTTLRAVQLDADVSSRHVGARRAVSCGLTAMINARHYSSMPAPANFLCHEQPRLDCASDTRRGRHYRLSPLSPRIVMEAYSYNSFPGLRTRLPVILNALKKSY